MKIGVIGQNSLAFQQALLFQELGAEVTLFIENEPLKDLQALQKTQGHMPYMGNSLHKDVQATLGIEIDSKEQTNASMWEGAYLPLLQKVLKDCRVKEVDVKVMLHE